MKLSKGNLSGRRKWALGLLIIVPLFIMVAKLPTAAFLMRFFSLVDLPPQMQNRVRYILFVPLSATLVVFFRLTLGIRVLGPFRSILIAVAFQITGIVLGLIFLVIVIGIIVAIRPLLRAIRLPYFGRVSVMLSAVASIMIITLLASNWLELDVLHRVAYFPIVVLCLTGEGFARTLSKEGLRSAMWRGAMTTLVAVLITLLSQIREVEHLFLRFPELLFVQIGCIVVIAEFFDLRLLQWLNPTAVKKQSYQSGKKVTKRLGKTSPRQVSRRSAKSVRPTLFPTRSGNTDHQEILSGQIVREQSPESVTDLDEGGDLHESRSCPQP